MIDDLIGSVLQQAAAQRDDASENVAQVWQGIENDLRDRGPFAAMLRSFQASAQEALTDLIFAPDFETTRRLQAEVRRYLQTMEIVHGFKDRAATLTPEDIDLSTEDDEYTPTPDED